MQFAEFKDNVSIRRSVTIGCKVAKNYSQVYLEMKMSSSHLKVSLVNSETAYTGIYR